MPSAPPGFQASPEVYFRCAEIIDSLGENEGADIEVEDEPFHLVWSALVQLTQKKRCVAQITWKPNRKIVTVFLEGRVR